MDKRVPLLELQGRMNRFRKEWIYITQIGTG